MSDQVVDPAVTRRKFDREVRAFRRREGMFRNRGWWLLKVEFPVVEIAFATVKLRPAAIAMCVRIDFTNFDLWPPSVTFIDPFTGSTLATAEQVGVPIARMNEQMQAQQIIQQHQGKPPFLCLPGVREYHDHPGHSGDNWLLHRESGAGGLFFIVDKLSTYGSESITGWQLEMQQKLVQGVLQP
jgi:hypothetical protein